MKDKEKIKNFFIYTGIGIVLVLALVHGSIFMMDTSNYIDESIRYRELEKFRENFEQGLEQLKEKTFENSQLRQEREKKNPLPLELRRDRFILFSELLKLHKKYLTDEEYGAFCLLYRDMQERELDTGEVKLMMYLISKVTDNATPEEMKIYEEGQELDRKIKDYFAQEEFSARDKK